MSDLTIQYHCLISRIEIIGSVGRRDGRINIMGRIDRVQRLRLTWRIK